MEFLNRIMTRAVPLLGTTFLAAFLAAAPLEASATQTIVKASLFEGGADVTFDGAVFSTITDGDLTSLGDQNTRVNFLGALDTVTDINDPFASFTLAGVTIAGAPTPVGPVVVQPTNGGTFSLWDESNTLLLSGVLNDGAITGSSTAETGSFFNVSFMSFTGGSLAPLLDPDSAGISFALSSIFGGGVLGLQIVNGALAPFTADGLVAIDGSPAAVPEPMSAALLVIGGGAAAWVRRRKVAA